MSFELRAITDDEYGEYQAAMGVGFGYHPEDGANEHARAMFERDRSVATFDAGRMVATAGVFSLEVTVPGLQSVNAGGVTAVSVLPTHRRQGVLTKMMQRMFDDVAQRGEPIAMLWASESIIYGRFGYGIATSGVRVDIERSHASLTQPVQASGRIRFIDKDTASKVLPEAFERFRRTQPGAVSRSPGWWEWHFFDPPWDRDGYSERFYAIHENAKGAIDGYVAYRRKGDWTGGLPGGSARVTELIATDRTTRTALWQLVLDLDLTARIHLANVPTDEPLRWQLADPRRFRVLGVTDNLWVRVLDIPAALAARRYAVDGQLTIEVIDTTRPDVAGRYELEAGPDGAVCKRSRRKADLALDIADLGALYLGGVNATTLTRAGRVEERTKGALLRADAMLVSSPAPWCNTDF